MLVRGSDGRGSFRREMNLELMENNTLATFKSSLMNGVAHGVVDFDDFIESGGRGDFLSNLEANSQIHS